MSRESLLGRISEAHFQVLFLKQIRMASVPVHGRRYQDTGLRCLLLGLIASRAFCCAFCMSSGKTFS
jgi:hypothetical protein